jgi:hypothetical protein
MWDLIDFFIRMVLIGFFVVFLINAIINYRNARKNKLEVSQKYFLAYFLFFLFSLINYLQTEIDIHFSIYPPKEEGFTLQLGALITAIPVQTVITIVLLIPSLIPLIFIIEKYFLNWKRPYLTVIGIIMLIVFPIGIIVPDTITFVTIFIAVGLLLMIAGFLSIYFRVAIKSSGVVRKSAILTALGWLVQIVGFIIPSLAGETDPVVQGLISHIIAIFGVIMIFLGMRLRRS